MGVDYSASFGIGFVVEPNEVKHLMIDQGDVNIDEFDDMEIMECLDLPEGLEYNYWGNSYSDNHTFFICASPNATSKEQMIQQWDQLEEFIKQHELKDKQVALIGGGLLW